MLLTVYRDYVLKNQRTTLVSLILLTCMLFLASCSTPLVPATAPPQINRESETSAENYVVITENLYDAGIFQLEYPENWRVVKSSISGAMQQEVVLVSPDEAIEITVRSVAEIGEDESTYNRFKQLDGQVVQIIGKSPAESAEKLAEAFEKVYESLSLSKS